MSGASPELDKIGTNINSVPKSEYNYIIVLENRKDSGLFVFPSRIWLSSYFGYPPPDEKRRSSDKPNAETDKGEFKPPELRDLNNYC